MGDENMIELKQEAYINEERLKSFINEVHAEKIYIYSMLENRQKGRVFVDNIDNIQNVLFWHYCGFAYVAGNGENEVFNHSLGKFIQGDYEANQSRFVLAVAEEKWKEVLRQLSKSDTIYERTRYQFKFNPRKFMIEDWKIPEGYKLKEIDEDLINKLEGRIIPSFSWENAEAFLQKGKAMCLVHNGEIACNAFSAAIGNGQMDIGIETNPNYRGKGLGKITRYYSYYSRRYS